MMQRLETCAERQKTGVGCKKQVFMTDHITFHSSPSLHTHTSSLSIFSIVILMIIIISLEHLGLFEKCTIDNIMKTTSL